MTGWPKENGYLSGNGSSQKIQTMFASLLNARSKGLDTPEDGDPSISQYLCGSHGEAYHGHEYAEAEFGRAYVRH